MSKDYQLRDYDVKPGAYDEFIVEWATNIVPLRRKFGFEVLGAWSNAERTRFVWMIAREDFETADRAYYASPERANLRPDITRHLSRIDATLLGAVPLPPSAVAAPAG
ncbi:MAG TPA: NIPSNAP family protein [Candidatus Dormibacteraeota bacterium]